MQYQPESMFANRYKLIKELGRGGFSVVWKAQDTMADDTEIAIKIYAPGTGLDQNGIKLFSREYSLVQSLNHQRLLKASYFDVADGSPFLVMPYCESGSLNSLLQEKDSFSEEEIAKVMAQVGEGLAYLHKNEILHQDIKPDNVLVDKHGDYLLTDFGISGRIRSTLRKSVGSAGSMTVAYSPPERFSSTPQSVPESDVFSLGVMLYELATGDVPWNGSGGVIMLQGAEVPDMPEAYSRRMNQWIQACMHKNSADRPSSKQIADAANEFLKTGAWSAVPAKENPPQAVADTPKKAGRVTEAIPQGGLNIPPVVENAAPKGTGNATIREGSGGSLEKKKSGSGMLIGIAAIAVVVIGIALYFFVLKPKPVDPTIPVVTTNEQFEKLKAEAMTLYNAAEYEEAKIKFSAALAFDDSASDIKALIDSCTAKLNKSKEPILVAKNDDKIINPNPNPKPIDDKTNTPKTTRGTLNLTSVDGDKFTYTGEIMNGMANGYGRAEYENGNIYEGNWVNNRRVGSGTLNYASKVVYVGSFEDDKISGRGIMSWPDGDKYDGQYANALRNGRGIYTFKTGDIYSGDWVANLRTGQGTYTWKDGSRYVGGWKDSKYHGYGTMYSTTGSITEQGNYEDGKFMGSAATAANYVYTNNFNGAQTEFPSTDGTANNIVNGSGKLNFKHKGGKGFFGYYTQGFASLDNSKNFNIEVTGRAMDIPSDASSVNYGLIFGREGSNYYRFAVGTDGQFAVHRYAGSWQAIIDWKSSSAVNKFSANKLKITKSGSTYLFYVNGTEVGRTSSITSWYGSGIGFGVSDGGTVDFTAFRFDGTRK